MGQIKIFFKSRFKVPGSEEMTPLNSQELPIDISTLILRVSDRDRSIYLVLKIVVLFRGSMRALLKQPVSSLQMEQTLGDELANF